MSVVATLLVRVAANLTELDKSFTDMERAADRIAKAYGKLGSQLQSIGGKLTTSLTLPIVGIGAAATKSFATFDTAMKGVQAAIQPTKGEMLALEAAAMEWGAKTQYSASEAADALGELGKAGVKTADSIELLPSVLNLATVGGMGLAEAAGLTTDTLTQFGLKANKASKVNDVLAKSAQVSTTSVEELGGALKYAGPVAGAFGMSIEETGASLALFANAGIKADMAGTALRGILTEVKSPAKGLKDVMEELGVKTLASADGTVHLIDVMRRLEERGASSEQIMRAFGDRAGPAMVGALAQGSGALHALNEQMLASDGTAKAVAETLLSGLGGALEKMRGAVETAGIALGKVLAPVIVYVAELIGDLADFVSGTLVPAFQSLPKAAQVAAGGILGITAAIGPLVYVSGTLISSFGAMAGLFAKSASGAASAAEASATVTRSFTLQAAATWIATTATSAFTGVMAVLLHPVTLVVAAVAGLVIGLRYLTGSWEGVLRVLTAGLVDFRTLENLWKGLKTLGDGVADGFVVLRDGITAAVTAITNEFTPAVDAMKRLVNDVGAALRKPFAEALKEVGGASSKAADEGVAKFAQALLDLSNRFAMQQIMAQFRGHLLAITTIVEGLVFNIVNLANMIRSQLIFAIEAVTRSIEGALAGMRTFSGWFGIEFPGSIAGAVNALANMGINLKGAGTAAAGYFGNLKTGIPTLREMAQASRDAADKQAILADQTSRAAGSFKAYIPGVTRAKTITELAGIQLGAFGDQLNDRLVPGMAAVVRAVVPAASGINTISDAAKEAAAAAAKARDELWDFYNKLTGQDVIENAFRLMNAFQDLTKKGFKLSAAAAEEVAEAIEDASKILIRQAKKVPPEMSKMYDSLVPPQNMFDQLSAVARKIDQFARGLVPSIDRYVGHIDDVLAGIDWEDFAPSPAEGAAIRASIDALGTEMRTQITGIVAGMFSGQTGIRDGFRAMFGEVQNLAAGVFREIGQKLGDELTDVFSGGTFNIKEIFGDAKLTAKTAAAGAAIGASVGAAFGQSFGMAAGIAAGAISGAAAGAMLTKTWAGALIGASVGAISGALSGIQSGKEKARAASDARAQLAAIYGGMNATDKVIQRLGFHWDDLWTTDDADKTLERIRLINVHLKHEETILKNLATGLDDVTAAGSLMSKSLIKDLDATLFSKERVPGSTEAITAFMDAQMQAATSGLDAFLSNTVIKTKEGAAAIAGTIAAMYGQLTSAGVAPTAAFAQLEPVIAKLQKQLVDTGFAGSEAFTPLADLARLSADAIAGPMFDAMAGLEQGLTATFNMGLLNQDAFAGFTAELLAGYKALEAQGKGGTVAMAGMQGALQKAWELSEDFGFSLGKGEQELIDYAESAGLIGDRFRPAADRMANAIDALVERFDRFLERLSTGLPAAANAAAAATQDAFRGLQMPTVEIPTRILPPDNAPAGYDGHRGQYIPALASGGIVSRPTVALIGESGPEAVVPLSSAFAAETDLTVYLDSEVITRAVLRKQPRQLRVYGAAR